MYGGGAQFEARPEELGEILSKVQEDLHQLREHIIHRNMPDSTTEIIDITSIENAIKKTEDSVRGRTEQILSVLNNQMTTLPALDLAAPSRHAMMLRADNENEFDLPAPPKRHHHKHLLGIVDSRGGVQAGSQAIPAFTHMEAKHGVFGPSPGQRHKFTMNMKAIENPRNDYNRQVLDEGYGITLPLINVRKPQAPIQTLTRGTTVEHLAVLPRQNRVDPQLLPPPITEYDARHGILSLLQRGLIPPAAELTLEPSPVHQKVVTLHDPEKRPRGPPPGVGEGTFHLNSVRLDPKAKPLHLISRTTASKSGLGSGAVVPASRLTRATSSTPSHSATSKSAGGAGDERAKSGSKLQPLPPPTTPASEIKNQHHRFAIQHGQIRESSQDFLAFKQHYCLAWGSIVSLLGHLERMLADYAVPLAFIHGDKLADLALEFELEMPSLDDLLTVVINSNDVRAIIVRPGRRFLGRNGREKAAALIQATWRRYQARVAYLEYRRKKWAAGVIAISWIMNVKMAKIRKNLKKTRVAHLEHFREKSLWLQREWARIKGSRRVLIHVPSLGYQQPVRESVKNFNIRQNLQMARLCELSDPQVEVIYVCPVTVNDDTLQYYAKLVGLGAALETGSPDPGRLEDLTGRYRIIVPEAANRFPSHSMCLSTLLRYSPKALNRIRHLIKGKHALLVPGVVHKDDLAVAQFLDVPVLGSEPELAQLYSTKSGAKRVFASARVEGPPGHYDIYSLQQLHECLAQLVVDNLRVKRWVLKLDEEFDGRGIASVDLTDHLTCYTWVLREEARYGDKWAKKWAHEPALTKILSEIPEILAKHGRPANSVVFPDWEAYIQAFLAQGGVVEAFPMSESVTAISVDMLLEPDGHGRMLTCGDQIHAGSEFTSWGMSVPQSSVEAKQLNAACQRVAAACHHRGIIGYFTVDFVTFIDPVSMRQRLWAVDLSVCYSDVLAMTQLMLYVTGGSLDAPACSFQVPPPIRQKKEAKRRPKWEKVEEEVVNTSRHAVISTRLLHTNLAVVHYSVFFQMCRAHGIGFDIKERQGTVFTLIDSFKREGIGMVCVGDQLQGVLASFARNLSVIHQEISAPNMQGKSNFQAAIKDIEGILGTTIQNVDRAKKEDQQEGEEGEGH